MGSVLPRGGVTFLMLMIAACDSHVIIIMWHTKT